MKILHSLGAPLLGLLGLLWSVLAKLPDSSLPSPARTWESSKL
jgi:hypothetical protein